MNPEKEYIFFCDESDRKGTYFSNFYGGVRVPASRWTTANDALLARKQALGLSSEIKWEKTDLMNVERYEQMMHAFFQAITEHSLAVRIMFTQNVHVPSALTEAHVANAYYILYYQFLKHAFGLRFLPAHAQPPRIRIYLDEMGDTQEKVAQFRGFLAGLAQDKLIRSHRLIIQPQDITEVRSHDHILMQCLDVVLGSITFRLNNKHLAIPPGQKRRGKRTVAKERLYKFILGEIRRVTGKPRFNIGITTALSQPGEGFWADPYLHWRFTPREHTLDLSKTKP